MDWKNIIHDLNECGLTQAQIAEACCTGQSYISALRSGVRGSPSWKIGESLVKLHKRATKKKSSEEAA